jgi:RHS repeat-associated protein
MTSEVTASGGATALMVADQALTNSGATGTRTDTFSVSAKLVGVDVVLKPAQYTYGYDTRGDRTTLTPQGGTAVSFGYDQANRLTSSNSGAASYAYNGDGLRMSRTVVGVTTQQTWDLAEGLPLLLVDGTTSYVTGPGGLPLEQVNATTVLYYHQDQLGSTRLLSDTSGAVAATYTYDAYGKLAAATGTITNPFGYAGQYTDPETGYQYLRARSYDPATAQLLTRDPAEAVTLSPYAYTQDNPLNGSDPSGLLCVTLVSKKRDLQEFDAAFAECQRRLGTTLTKDQRRQLHDAVHNMHYHYREILDECLGMFGGGSKKRKKPPFPPIFPGMKDKTPPQPRNEPKEEPAPKPEPDPVPVPEPGLQL